MTGGYRWAIVVFGQPAPQGSKRARGDPKTGKMWTVEQNKIPVDEWRSDVKDAALRRAPEAGFAGPVAVAIVFAFTRPRSHYRTGRNARLLRDKAPIRPLARGDIDKLLRSTFDALTAAGIWHDDKQVTEVYAICAWAGEPGPASEFHVAGASISIQPITTRE